MFDLLVEPWRRHETQRPRDVSEALVTTSELAHVTDRIVTARILTNIAREKKLSLSGKLAALTESAQDFHKGTEAVLDGIASKIKTATLKRDIAAEKHHGFYDGIIKGVDESTAVIDRLSNGPLSEDGEN